MRTDSPLRDTLRALWTGRGVWLLNMVLSAVIIYSVWLWFSIPDATVGQLIATAVIALVLIFVALWLRVGTLAFFVYEHVEGEARLWPAFRRALPRIPAMIAAGIILGAVMFPIVYPMIGTRRHVLAVVLHIVLTYAAIALFMPVVLQAAAWGFRGLGGDGWRAAVAAWKAWRYWLALALIGFVGVWIPWKLVWWVPLLGSLQKELTSLILRFGTAYTLVITCFLAMLSLIARFGAEVPPPAAAAKTEGEAKGS